MKVNQFFILIVFLLVGFASFAQSSIHKKWNLCIDKYDAKEYNDVISISKEILNSTEISAELRGEAYSLQGDAYYDKKVYQEAVNSYEKAFNLSSKFKKIDLAKSIAHVYVKDKKANKAIVWFDREYDLALSLNLPKKAILSKISMAKLYSNYGDYVTAKEEIATAKELSNKNSSYKSSEIASILQLIKENKEVDNNLTTSFEKESSANKNQLIEKILIEKAKSITEIEKLSKANQLIEYRIKAQADEYEKRILSEQLKTLKKEKELASKNAKLKLTKLVLREEKALNAKRKLQLMGSIIVLILLSIVIFTLIILYRFKQKTSAELILKNEKIGRQKSEIEVKAKHIEDSIQYSRKIQQAILPTTASFKATFPNSFVYLRPKEKVSGDFFWHYRTNDLFYAAAIDCTGHGVPGAFMSIICKQVLDEAVTELESPLPSDILELASKKLTSLFSQHSLSSSIIKDGMDLSIFRYNKNTQELIHTGARNSLYLVRDKKLIELKGNKTSIGYSSLISNKRMEFTNNTLEIKKGDRIFLFSDGFADQKGGEQNKKYFYTPFKSLLLETSNVPLEKQRELLSIAFSKWIGQNEQIDDVLILAVEF